MPGGMAKKVGGNQPSDIMSDACGCAGMSGPFLAGLDFRLLKEVPGKE